MLELVLVFLLDGIYLHQGPEPGRRGDAEGCLTPYFLDLTVRF